MSGEPTFASSDAVDLLEWKHSIFDLYAGIRGATDPYKAWRDWRDTRDRMYRSHPQSPIPADTRADFAGCSFYEYDASWRTTANIEDADPSPRDVAASTGGTFSFTRIGITRFTLHGVEHELELAWNGGYGGNTGIHDGHNLAWKLALVLKGIAGPRLLETYEAERR